MMSCVNAWNAAEKVNVLVTVHVVRPRNAHAPSGSGLRMRPDIVEMNMESKFHACGVISLGFGTRKRRMRPVEMETMSGIGFAP